VPAADLEREDPEVEKAREERMPSDWQ
jgi:hypothetical protein